MGDNGHGAGIPFEAQLTGPRAQVHDPTCPKVAWATADCYCGGHGPAPARTVADLSSRERSQLTDEMVVLLRAMTLQVDTLTRLTADHTRQLREHRAMLDAHAGIVYRPSRWTRLLRWLGASC